MHRNLIIIGCVLASALANAAESEVNVATKLNAQRIIEITPSICVGDGLSTPVSVRYVKDGDAVPSCGLLLSDGGYIDFVSPEPGQSLPACATPLKKPSYFKLKEPYLVYEYTVEDPRARFTRFFQLFRIGGDHVEACKNDGQITDLANRNIKQIGIIQAFKEALDRFGCE